MESVEVYPNPFRKSTTLLFKLSGSKIPNELQVELINSRGKLVRRLTNLLLDKVRTLDNILECWYVSDLQAEELSTGMYFFKVQAVIENLDGSKKTIQKTGKLIVVH